MMDNFISKSVAKFVLKNTEYFIFHTEKLIHVFKIYVEESAKCFNNSFDLYFAIQLLTL